MSAVERAAAWSNWSGYVSARPQAIAEPRDLQQLADAVRAAPGPVRIRGAGHSFAPLVVSRGTILSLDAFSGVSAHDPEALTARAGAGTKIGALARMLHERGQAFPNMGDIDKQAFGGALGTATHGSGVTLGAYHTQVEALQLVDGRGKVRAFSRRDNPGEMAGLLPGLGAFGAVTEVTIRNVAPYRLRRRRRTLPLGDMLAGFEALMSAHRSAEFYYIPFSRTVLFIASDLSDAPAVARPPDGDNDGLVTLKRVGRLVGWLPPLRRAILRPAIARVAREDYVSDWLRVYPSERELRFNEMEYHLPFEEGPKALAEVVGLLERSFADIYFPIEVRTVAADDALLSPFHRRQTVSIAIHHEAGLDPLPYFNAMEPIFRRRGGRPHWGKMHGLVAADLEKLYPRFREAMELRREIDPDGRFVSPYVARLFGIAT